MLSLGAAALGAVALVPVGGNGGHGHWHGGRGWGWGGWGGVGARASMSVPPTPILGARLWLGALPLALLANFIAQRDATKRAALRLCCQLLGQTG